jgi:hypothetical protein
MQLCSGASKVEFLREDGHVAQQAKLYARVHMSRERVTHRARGPSRACSLP